MSSKVNLVLNDEVRTDLFELVPAEERSRFANEALKARLSLLKRGRAVDQLAALREKGPSASTAEVVEALRQTRNAT